MSSPIPVCDNLVLIRTCFADEKRWRELLHVAQSQPEPFAAWFKVVDDPSFDGKVVDQVLAALPKEYAHEAIFIADERAVSEEGFPCLIVGPLGGELQIYRAVASELAGIDSNLSIANMGYEEFAGAAGPDGVFRGFE